MKTKKEGKSKARFTKKQKLSYLIEKSDVGEGTQLKWLKNKLDFSSIGALRKALSELSINTDSKIITDRPGYILVKKSRLVDSPYPEESSRDSIYSQQSFRPSTTSYSSGYGKSSRDLYRSTTKVGKSYQNRPFKAHDSDALTDSELKMLLGKDPKDALHKKR